MWSCLACRWRDISWIPLWPREDRVHVGSPVFTDPQLLYVFRHAQRMCTSQTPESQPEHWVHSLPFYQTSPSLTVITELEDDDKGDWWQLIMSECDSFIIVLFFSSAFETSPPSPDSYEVSVSLSLPVSDTRKIKRDFSRNFISSVYVLTTILKLHMTIVT